MEKLKNYGFSLLLEIGILLGLCLLMSAFYYFNWLPTTIVNYLKIFIVFVATFVGGIYLGKKAKQKGYLEGIIGGIIWVFLLFLFSYLALREGLKLRMLLYYVILITTSMLGSMIGINHKKGD